MNDNASRRFDLSTNPFLELFSSKYSPQSPGSCTLYHLPTEVLYSVISALHNQPCTLAIYPTAGPSPSTISGQPYTPTRRSTTCLRTQTSPLLISFRCTATGFFRVTNRSDEIDLSHTRLQRRGILLPRFTFWKVAATPENPTLPTQRTLTSA